MTWTSQSLKKIERFGFAGLSRESLAIHAYALACCRSAAAVSDGEFRDSIVRICDSRLRQLHKLAGEAIEPVPARASRRTKGFDQDLSVLSVEGLVALHSAGPGWGELRCKAGLEPVTRIGQWRVVDELISRDGDSPLAHILLIAECLEAENLARSLSLPYSIGQKPRPFNLSAYDGDGSLADHIRSLSRRRTYMAREELIAIADHIQRTVVDAGTTADHLSLVLAILSTGMPQFRYPKILSALEKATKNLAKSGTVSRMDLAPAYRVLWSHTLKASYLDRYESAVRHCYLALADGRTYPGLGVERDDPRSLHAAVRFLNENRQSLWVLNPGYDVDKLIRRYTLQTG